MRPFFIAVYAVGLFFLLMPVYDQLVPIEPSEDTVHMVIEDRTYVYEVDVPVTASQFPLSRCGYYVDAYRFTEPDDCIRSLASQIVSETGFSGLWLVDYYRAFVRDNIEYESDRDSHGRNEYWQLPTETLILGTGDCEDRAFLFISLCRASGFDCVIVNEPGHVSAGGYVEGEGHHISYEGRKYLTVDPSSKMMAGLTEPEVEYIYGTGFGREQAVFFTITAFLLVVMSYSCLCAIFRS